MHRSRPLASTVVTLTLIAVLGALAACGSDPAGPLPAGTITGRVVAPEGTPLPRLFARWSDGERERTVAVGSDGRFTVPAEPGTSGELLIDQHGTRTIHPFLYPFDADDARNLRVVLVPREWTIRKGIHTGTTVEISLNLVMDDVSGLSYYNVMSQGTHLQYSLTPLSRLVLPLKVAIVHEYGPNDKHFTPADSATLWQAFNRMEEVIGENLFEPVNADPAWVAGGPRDIPGVVLVRRLNGVIAAAKVYTTSATQDWSQDLGAWAAGGRFTRFNQTRGWVQSGQIFIGNTPEPPMGWGTVYTHEMLHVLGVGHTSNIPSPQGPVYRTSEPSEHDVAYMEMMREILILERRHQTSLSVMPATIGQRKLELGLPALPVLRDR